MGTLLALHLVSLSLPVNSWRFGMRFILVFITVMLSYIASSSAEILRRQAPPGKCSGCPAMRQTDTSTGCAISCIDNSQAGNCVGDGTACRCSSQSYLDQVKSCFSQSCSGEDVGEAQTYLTQFCLNVVSKLSELEQASNDQGTTVSRVSRSHSPVFRPQMEVPRQLPGRQPHLPLQLAAHLSLQLAAHLPLQLAVRVL